MTRSNPGSRSRPSLSPLPGRRRVGVLLAAALLAWVAESRAATGVLEIPADGSSQSGVGTVSGWVCDADAVSVVIDGTSTFATSYGTPRGDTQGVCGDTDNGYGLLINWSLFGDGEHEVVLLADGVEIDRASFTVTTFGVPFLRGAAGIYRLPDFEGSDVFVAWQEGAQSFYLVHDPTSRPDELLADLEKVETQERMIDENAPVFLRAAAERLNPEIVELIASGPAAVPSMLEAFTGTADLLDDVPLSLLAYALEQIGDDRAVPVLADWLEANLFSDLLWATDMVTHALKVLSGQGGLNTATFVYDIDAKLDAIAQARIGAQAAAAAAVESAAAASDPVVCPQKVIVTGIDASGKEVSVTLGYTTSSLDIQDRVARETNPTKKAAFASQVETYRDADRRTYGDSDYLPIGGADVSTRYNCGGSVTERLINRIAEERGFPVRLTPGANNADSIRDLARTFGGTVGASGLDLFTVISHEYETGNSKHVEIPLSRSGSSAVIYSKDNSGAPRSHTINVSGPLNFLFGPVLRRYNFSPFGGDLTTRFYRLDPSRITGIVVDSSGCPCTPGAEGNIPLAITEPASDETAERVVDVGGTVGEPSVVAGTLRLNNSPQPIAVAGGAFAAKVVLSSGPNVVRVSVDGDDGRRGCAERTITSTTPKTTLSATLTWNLPRTDVDLYVTQPDGETSWFSDKSTSIGGLLDVDNTSGFGPENYFLSSADGDTVLPGGYQIRVHYYRDADQEDDEPARVVGWRVVVLLNEGTPAERRQIFTGTLTAASSTNDSPGSSGPDWGNVTTVALTAEGGSAAVAEETAPLDEAAGAGPVGLIENPSDGSRQSGIGLFSGWICDADEVTIEVDGDLSFRAAYGTPRGDTAGVCGDTNNGFAALFNWALLDDGGHVVRVLADGVELGRTRFIVKTLGTSFLRGASGRYLLPDFDGRDVTVEWQEGKQNFGVIDVE